MTSNNLFAVGRHIGHDRNLPGAFNRQSQFTLMRSAVSGNPARHNLAPFGHKIIENRGIFIINLYIGIRAKAAEFLSVKNFFWGYRFGLSELCVSIFTPLSLELLL